MSESTDKPGFSCPHCGGEIQYSGTGATARCAYCGASVPVPKELRPASIALPSFAPAMNVVIETGQPIRAGRASSIGCILFVVIFLVIGGVVFAVINSVTHSIDTATRSLQSDAGSVKATVIAATNPTREPTRAAPTAVPTPAFAEVALQFGSKGMGAGQFDNAHAGGIDGAGHIYVGEYVGGRIQVFDSAGKFISQFFAGDKHTDLLGFVVDRKGIVYVADGADITRYDGATGKSLGKLNYSGGPGFGELALAPDGGLYAMWYQRRSGLFTSTEGAREDLVRFDNSAKVVKVFSGVISSMTENLELDNALAVDGRGNVYIAAQNESTIFKFGSDGKFITRIGSSGSGASQFGSLGAIAVDGQGRIFIVDSSDIKVLKPDGSLLNSIKVTGAARQLVFDDAGALLVTTDDGVVKYQLK